VKAWSSRTRREGLLRFPSNAADPRWIIDVEGLLRERLNNSVRQNIMSMIRPSEDLRNRYLDISEYCHTHDQPVFVTRNGTGDLAVMSIELYEQLIGRRELYAAVETGIRDEESGRTVAGDDAIQRAREQSQE
jgi:prevent-host-death family protein